VLAITKLLDFSFVYRKNVVLDSITRRPVLDPATGKPMEIFHPMVPCTVSSEGRKSPLIEGLLDSGSDGIVIPRSLAEYLDLRLIPEARPMRVANGRDVQRYTAKATITLGRGGRCCDPIDAEVSVPAEGDPPLLIGREPIFRLFVITFVEPERRFEMKPYRAK
jgi:predicted aspartyl protease